MLPCGNQRLPEQLMDEQTNPKFTFASVAKQVFVPNYWYKNICHLTFIRIKIKSFSCETFCTSTRCEKEANGNSEVEVKPASMCACQATHQARAYSSFCSMKRLEVFLLPLGLDASPSQGYLQHLICQYLFIHLSGYLGAVRVVSRPGTEHNVSSQGWNPDCSKQKRNTEVK